MDRGGGQVSAEEAASALAWWADAGVDCLVGETPHNWLTSKSPTSRVAEAAARPIVQEPDLPAQLELFRNFLAESHELPFAASAAPRVCPSGDPASDLMLLTDMPTEEDCVSGSLISGEQGQLLDRMLAAIGRNRETIYLASVSCLRAPGGSFNSDGASQCARLARHHIGLVAPKAVLLLGDACCKAMLGLGVLQARGRWHKISTHSGDMEAMASFHPSYLLDRPSAKKHAWADLQMLMEKLGQ